MSYSLLRPLLFALDAETAHHFSLEALRVRSHLAAPLATLRAFFRPAFVEPSITPASASSRRVMGLDFPNPVGLAAGLDKNGEYIDALAALGFGFIEVGTVTPRPQPGNPRPRLFRVVEAQAIINRMGFNNDGVDRLVDNVQRANFRGILGINIGKNFDTPLDRAAEDYIQCLRKVYARASYVTVNISSPNTKDLRELQGAERLEGLLGALTAERRRLADIHGKRVPLAVKIAPDLDRAQIGAIAELVQRHEIDAVIATNTTIARDGVSALPHGNEPGGLSGAPLAEQANGVVRRLATALGSALPIIGVGGIMSGADAGERIAAGASLVQLYTGLIYRGPGLVRECVEALCGETC